MKAVQALRDESGFSAERLALELYERAGSRGTVETYQRRFRGCFDQSRTQDVFAFWEVVAMMEFTGVHEPLFYQCELLGYKRPERADPDEQVAALQVKLQDALEEVSRLRDEIAKRPTGNEKPIRAVRFARSTTRGE